MEDVSEVGRAISSSIEGRLATSGVAILDAWGVAAGFLVTDLLFILRSQYDVIFLEE